MNKDAAEEGNMLHAACETGDTTGLDDPQKEDVENALAYKNGLMTGPGVWEDGAEARVTLEDLTYGTSDRVLYNEEQALLHVIDFKFTRVAGDHEFQARTYAAGTIEELLRLGKPVKKVFTHVVAPRLNITETTEYDDPEALLAHVRKDIEDLYEKIDNPWNAPTPHGDLCKNCARAGGCPALATTAVAVSKGLGLPLPTAFSPDALVAVKDRALAHAVAMALENWSKEVKKQNTDFVKETGKDLPGYALRSRSTGARVAKEDTPLAVEMLRVNGFSDDEILQGCRISLNDVAKVHAEGSTDSIQKTKERVKGLLSSITTEGQSTFLQKTKRVSEEQLIKQLTEGTSL
jgi:hypothetical protein